MSLIFLTCLFFGVFLCGLFAGIALAQLRISSARRREDLFIQSRKARVLRRV